MSLEQIVGEFDALFASLAGGQPEDRASIWGQALQESNFNPGAIEKPGTNIGGIDLWQHTGPRRRAYEAFAAAHNKPWQDVATQVRFVAQELTGGDYKHAWQQIQHAATTLRTKTETAMGLFEGPANWQQEIKNPGSTTANLPRRLKGATQALAVITAAKPGEAKVTDLSGQATGTAAQLTQLETEGEAIGNQLITRAFPQFAPIVSMIETRFVNPFLPTVNAKLGVQIDGNAAAHAIFEGVLILAGFAATYFLAPKAPANTA